MAGRTIQPGEQRRYRTIKGKLARIPLRTLLTADREVTHVRVRQGFPEADMVTISVDDEQGQPVKVQRGVGTTKFCLARLPRKSAAVEATFGADNISIKLLEPAEGDAIGDEVQG
jgi:hypothetical protein